TPFWKKSLGYGRSAGALGNEAIAAWFAAYLARSNAPVRDWPPQATAARKANVVARPAATGRQPVRRGSRTRRGGGNKLTSREANTAGISSLKAWRKIQASWCKAATIPAMAGGKTKSASRLPTRA